jgi:leader peptidase (prepilin peptidase)/N-methyltransferase
MPVALSLLLAALGALVVAPVLSDAVLRWIGWRVVLPQMTGDIADRRSLGRPPARCSNCGHLLARPALPAVPTLAWLSLGGRCPGCRQAVPRWVLGIEVATGVLWGLVGLAFGWSAALVPVLIALAGWVAASAVDLACWRIPTRFVYLTGVPVVVTVVGAALVDGEPRSLEGGLLGMAVYVVFLGTLWLISPRMLGFGDVRLGGLVGLVVGWVGWTDAEPVVGPLVWVVRALLAAGLLGSIVGAVLAVVRRRNQPYPFGPWLSLGGVIALLLAA